MTFPSSNGTEHVHAAYPAPPARVFVGLKIPLEIASQLAKFAAALEAPSVRPVAPANIHLTLLPPWNETSIPDAIAKLGRVTSGFSAFQLIFQHVGYGPQPRRPRLLWADCAATDEITAFHAGASGSLWADGRSALPAARHSRSNSRIRAGHRAEKPD